MEEYKDKINKYLTNLKLELHPDKSNIIPLRNGITFLGYRIFYHYKLLRKSNLKKFKRNFKDKLELCESGGGRSILTTFTAAWKDGLVMQCGQILINSGKK